MLAVLLAVVVGTWNGNWFPSGRAEHRANPEVEAATIRESGKMLRAGYAALDPAMTNGLILCLNEMRGPKSAQALAEATGIPGLRLAITTRYRVRDRFDYQQDAILTTLPVVASDWSLWRQKKDVRPGHGYAHVLVLLEPAVTAAVYAVHLKSNYRQKGEAEIALNRAKRAYAVEQLIELENAGKDRPARPVVIAGDYNADRHRREFAEDTLFDALDRAGYSDVMELLPPEKRGTYPNPRWGDSTLDHICLRGLVPDGPPHIQPNDELSDHLAVFCRLK